MSALQRVHSDGAGVEAHSVLVRGHQERFPSLMCAGAEQGHDGNLSPFKTIRENVGFVVEINLRWIT